MSEQNGKVIDGTGVQKSSGGVVYVEFGRAGVDTLGVIQERLPKMQGKTARQVYQDMDDNDSTVGAIMFAVEMMLRAVEWTVEPAKPQIVLPTGAPMPSPTPVSQGGSSTEMKVAQHTLSCLEDLNISWTDVLSQIMSMLPHGWALFELVYKRRLGPDPGKVTMIDEETGKEFEFELPPSKFDDGLVGWRKIAFRPQDTLYRWNIDDNGGIRGMWQQGPPDYRTRYIPIEKALLFRTSVKRNNPEGRSIYRNAVRPFWHKRRIENIEGVGIERDLAGLPKGFMPANWFMEELRSDDEAKAAEAFIKTVQNIKRDENEGVVLPALFDEDHNRLLDIELMSTGGKRNFDTDKIISRYRQEIATTVLADFILLGQDAVGSRALANPKIGMFQAAIAAWLDAIASVFNDHAIPRLMRLNGWDASMAPKLEHSDVEQIDLGELGEYVAKMAQAGFMWAADPAADNYFRTAAKVPVTEQTEEL